MKILEIFLVIVPYFADIQKIASYYNAKRFNITKCHFWIFI